MPSFTVIIQPEAEVDLDEAHQYFEQQKSGLGFQLLEDVTEVIGSYLLRYQFFPQYVEYPQSLKLSTFG